MDRVETGHPRRVDALWHFHPECEVELDGATCRARRTGNTMTVAPVGGLTWSTTLARGQVEPEIQGWHSPEYNIRVPAP